MKGSWLLDQRGSIRSGLVYLDIHARWMAPALSARQSADNLSGKQSHSQVTIFLPSTARVFCWQLKWPVAGASDLCQTRGSLNDRAESGSCLSCVPRIMFAPAGHWPKSKSIVRHRANGITVAIQMLLDICTDHCKNPHCARRSRQMDFCL